MEFGFLQMRKWYGIIFGYFFHYTHMGFFDIGVDTTANASKATATAPTDTSVSFDSSDLLIIDDTVSSASSTPAAEVTSAELPNTVGEIFTAPAFDVNFDMETSMAAEATAHETESHAASGLSFDLPSFDAPAVEVAASSETAMFSETVTEPEVAAVESELTETPTVDFMPSFDMTPEVETAPAVIAPALEVAAAVETTESIDPESTLRKAIAELESIASKIQAKADAAFAEEARLLEEKKAAEAAHKLAMDTLKKAAEAARNTALDIQKSGERTAKIKSALEAQAA